MGEVRHFRLGFQ